MQESQPVDEFETASYLSPGDAAEMLGVTTTTLAAWAEVGAVEAIRLPSGHRRYLESSLRALIEKRSA